MTAQSCFCDVRCAKCKWAFWIYSQEFLSFKDKTNVENTMTAEAMWNLPYHLTPQGLKCTMDNQDAFERRYFRFFGNASSNIQSVEGKTIQLSYASLCPACNKIIDATWLKPVEPNQTETHLSFRFYCVGCKKAGPSSSSGSDGSASAAYTLTIPRNLIFTDVPTGFVRFEKFGE